MKVICYIDDPSPIAYQDVYEEGDEVELFDGQGSHYKVILRKVE